MNPFAPSPPGSRLRRHGRTAPAFSLLEMMMVMFILTLLLGAIFGIVRGTLQLSNDMTQAQTADGRLHGFAQFCERTFRNLPADTLVRLRVKQQGNHYLSELAIKGAPAAFAMQGAVGNEVMILQTEEQVDGYLHVVLRSMTATQALAWEKGDNKVGRKLPLLENVAVFEWRLFNVQSGEWEPVWNPTQPLYPLGAITANPAPEAAAGTPPAVPQPGGPRGLNPVSLALKPLRPQLVELRLAIGADPAQRWLFWTPPAETPSGSSGTPNPITPPPVVPNEPEAPMPNPEPEPQ